MRLQFNDPTGGQDKPVKKIVRKKAARGADKNVTLGDVALAKKSGGRPGLFAFTLQVIYKNLYILGITLLRRRMRYHRKLQKAFRIFIGRTYAFHDRNVKAIVRFGKDVSQRLQVPVARISYTRNELAPAIQAAKERGQIPLSAYLRIAGAISRFVWRIIATILNHVAPIAAAWLLVHTISLYIHQPLGLAVEYDDEVIGYIDNESEFESAVQTLRERFIDNASQTIVKIPHFKLVGVTLKDAEESVANTPIDDALMRLEIVKQEYSTKGALADKIVAASDSAIEQAYGLYVNNIFRGAITDRDYLFNELEELLDNASTGVPGERTEFVKHISIREGLYPLDSVVSMTDMDKVIHANESERQVYIVQEGDSPSLIASKHGISLEALFRMNPHIKDGVMIGMEVYTELERPYISVKNISEAVYNEEFDYETVEVESAAFTLGYREPIQAGEPGIQRVKAEVTKINGVETERKILETHVVKAPVNEQILVGTLDPKTIQSGPVPQTDRTPSNSTSSSGFIWPTQGGYINVGVGGYPGHTGIDIPRPPNTPIYASASGIVIVAKYSYTGYGNHIIIDHGNGYTTYYAHATSLYVSVGQVVNQGDVIAGVGRTGNSSGDHLHFEIRQNGRVMIPQNYVGGW